MCASYIVCKCALCRFYQQTIVLWICCGFDKFGDKVDVVGQSNLLVEVVFHRSCVLIFYCDFLHSAPRIRSFKQIGVWRMSARGIRKRMAARGAHTQIVVTFATEFETKKITRWLLTTVDAQMEFFEIDSPHSSSFDGVFAVGSKISVFWDWPTTNCL